MSEISANSKNIFLPRKSPILTLEVGFFSDRKRFFADFRKFAKKFFTWSYLYKKNRQPFWIGSQLITTASRWLSGKGRRS